MIKNITKFEKIPEKYQRLGELLGYVRLLDNTKDWFYIEISKVKLNWWFPVNRFYEPGENIHEDLDFDCRTFFWVMFNQDLGWQSYWAAENSFEIPVFEFIPLEVFKFHDNSLEAAIASGEIFR